MFQFRSEVLQSSRRSSYFAIELRLVIGGNELAVVGVVTGVFELLLGRQVTLAVRLETHTLFQFRLSVLLTLDKRCEKTCDQK